MITSNLRKCIVVSIIVVSIILMHHAAYSLQQYKQHIKVSPIVTCLSQVPNLLSSAVQGYQLHCKLNAYEPQTIESSVSREIFDISFTLVAMPTILRCIGLHCRNQLFLYALKNNHADLAAMLIQAQFIDPNYIQVLPTFKLIPQAITTCNPLHYAAEAGYLAMVNVLIVHGAQVALADTQDKTVEEYAEISGHDTQAMQQTKRDIQRVLRFHRARQALIATFDTTLQRLKLIQENRLRLETMQEIFDTYTIPADITHHLAPFIMQKNSGI